MKTSQRVVIVEEIAEALKGKQIYSRIKVANMSESKLRSFMYSYLLETLERIYRAWKPKVEDATIKRNADIALLWDGDERTVINSLQFLGVQHRPDFEIRIEGFRIGIEVKRGDSGKDIRAGLGQSLVYTQKYDFVIYLFADTSRDKKILNSIKEAPEKAFLASIWDNYNIRFEVV